MQGVPAIEDLMRRVEDLEAEQKDIVMIIQKLWFAEGMPGDQQMKEQEKLLPHTKDFKPHLYPTLYKDRDPEREERAAFVKQVKIIREINLNGLH
jgi:hypothetical protein